MTKPINLVPYLDQLSDKQRVIIMRCVNLKKENDGERAWVHLGILPFVTHAEAYWAVKSAWDRSHGDRGTRILAEILQILDIPIMHVRAAFTMRLDDRKVYRHFGKTPERGKVMSWLPKQKVTVGFTNKFGKMKPDTGVWVSPSVRLVKNAPGYYTVEVLVSCKDHVKEWLHANCG